ncbi:hypothetical protein [Streptomyces sp. NPDC059881]|uniref:hypothetical protein n=1 Tax=Streptomyces sp. NPDC059881 TaxID=3346986 RepID=UPI003660CCC9
MKEIVWEVFGLNDAKECIENPALAECILAGAAFLPVGKLKLIKKAGEKVDDVIHTRRSGDVARGVEVAAGRFWFRRRHTLPRARC